jgi:signal transduction histidine kinase
MIDKTGKDSKDMQFPAFLASIAHDMKNSLGMLITTIDEIIAGCSSEDCRSKPMFSRLQYESKRVNNNLIQLLTLYRMDKSHYNLNIEYNSVPELLEDAVIQNRPLLEFRNISLRTECQEDLSWFFDRDLIAGVLNNVLNNAYRYANGLITITAGVRDGYLAIDIADDGQGYPDYMLTGSAGSGTINFSTGSTGLGLYFASIVAEMHNNRGKEGYIRTSNCNIGGGGCFSIFLP